MNGDQGVTTGLREIYNQMLGMSKSLQTLDNRMEQLEMNFKVAPEADERSKVNNKELSHLGKSSKNIRSQKKKG